MYHTECYKYEKDGVVCVGGIVPEGATILETMDILNADEGKTLIRISDEENMGSSVWLKDSDVEENYEEVEDADIRPDTAS